MPNVLGIRLKRPPGTELILIHRRHEGLKPAHRPPGSEYLLEIGIERSDARRDMRVGHSDAEFVLGPLIVQSNLFSVLKVCELITHSDTALL